MANDAVLQVRIDSQLKSEVEQLYREMGTTFSEAVRLFARQSLLKRRLPFEVCEGDCPVSVPMRNWTQPMRPSPNHGDAGGGESGFAFLAEYAGDEKRALEETAWRDAAIARHIAQVHQLAGKAMPSSSGLQGDAR